MSEVKLFLQEIAESQSVPKWVQIKASLLLEEKSISNKCFLTGEELLSASIEYFKLPKDFMEDNSRKKTLVEKKHLIRYALYLNGLSFEQIAKLINCDRTTTYNSLKFIKDVTSVDADFRNEVDNYLNYLEVKKIV